MVELILAGMILEAIMAEAITAGVNMVEVNTVEANMIKRVTMGGVITVVVVMGEANRKMTMEANTAGNPKEYNLYTQPSAGPSSQKDQQSKNKENQYFHLLLTVPFTAIKKKRTSAPITMIDHNIQ